jgi:hypothetical protein
MEDEKHHVDEAMNQNRSICVSIRRTIAAMCRRTSAPRIITTSDKLPQLNEAQC